MAGVTLCATSQPSDNVDWPHAAALSETPGWLRWDADDLNLALTSGSKHTPLQIADLAAAANVPGLAVGTASRKVVEDIHEVGPCNTREILYRPPGAVAAVQQLLGCMKRVHNQVGSILERLQKLCPACVPQHHLPSPPLLFWGQTAAEGCCTCCWPAPAAWACFYGAAALQAGAMLCPHCYETK